MKTNRNQNTITTYGNLQELEYNNHLRKFGDINSAGSLQIEANNPHHISCWVDTDA